jgi:hypothetical protein
MDVSDGASSTIRGGSKDSRTARWFFRGTRKGLLNLGIKIPRDDSVRLLVRIAERIDWSKLSGAYARFIQRISGGGLHWA